jgi:general secretion pathway protein D
MSRFFKGMASLLVISLVAGCAAPPQEHASTGLEATQSISAPRPTRGYESSQLRPPSASGPTTMLLSGDPGGSQTPLYQNDGDKVTLNLVNVPIAVACKTVFSDILRKNFTLSDNVSGAVTLQTTQPTSKQALVESFEAVLRARGFGLSRQGDTFVIAPADPGNLQNASFTGDQSVGVGRQARIVQLHNVSAKDMADILKAVSPNGVLRADTDRNVVVISGSAQEMNAMLQAVNLFDVDWMRDKVSALYKLESGVDPTALVKQIDRLFASGNGSVAEGAIKFVPSRELGGILVIASQRSLLERAGGIIRRMDSAAADMGKQTYIYKVENRTAKELASVVNAAFGGRNGQARTGLADPASSTTTTMAATATSSDQAATVDATTTQSTSSSSGISVVADESNNSLVIVASRRDYERVLNMVSDLDRMPGQVLIEAVIVEAQLNDELKFGLKYSLHGINFSSASDGSVTGGAPGFTYSASAPDIRVALQALSQITNVKVVSSPSLTVLDNRTAKLQIGDQVPVISASQTSAVSSVTTTQVEMKDTGVILNVTPRISSNGNVLLNVEQEVSDVVTTTTSTINSPTIRQRKVASTILVGDGQSIVIGGLVQESRQKATTAVPILGNLPVVGNAFRSRDDTQGRTELMIFIRTRVMRDQTRAQSITNEFRNRLDAISIKRPPEKPISDWDLIRMVN